jgi:hypothetical protein
MNLGEFNRLVSTSVERLPLATVLLTPGRDLSSCMVMRACVIVIVFGAVLGVQSPTASLATMTEASLGSPLLAAVPPARLRTNLTADPGTLQTDDSRLSRHAGSTLREDALEDGTN